MKIAIYIPSKDRNGQYLNPDLRAEAVNKTKRKLAAMLGGFTAYNGHGGWVDDSGRIMEEYVTVIYSTTPIGVCVPSGLVREFAGDLAAELNQSSVMVEFNNSSELIPPTKIDIPTELTLLAA